MPTSRIGVIEQRAIRRSGFRTGRHIWDDKVWGDAVRDGTDPDDDPMTSLDPALVNQDGTVPGEYNPYAEVAIVATGVRNAHDLVWHSNANL